jgi:hypothetical protein
MKLSISIMLLLFLLAACEVPENDTVRAPVSGIIIVKNQSPPENGKFEMMEGRSLILGAWLLPEGVQGGIHWQSSSRGIVELNRYSGPEINITGVNGGKTIITVMARNILNEVYAEAECTVTVIPSSFFKWNYKHGYEINLEPRSNYRSNYIMGTINEILIRTGENPIIEDQVKGGIILDGADSRLIIGSGMITATNSPFSDPVYDEYGQFNFFSGPGADYYLWAGRVRISVDYEILDTAVNKSLLRIQVNNNTGGQDNASAISNWLVAELSPNSKPQGVLSGVFNKAEAKLVKTTGIPGINQLETVLSRSFVCLNLPDGKLLIRSIRIESAD